MANEGPDKGEGIEAPAQSFRWLRPFLPKRMQPWLRGLRKKWQLRSLNLEEPYRTVFPYTQASPARQRNLVRMGTELEQKGISGAIVECGVLDGGTAALMGYATKPSGRPIHLFDAWEGLPETVEQDGAESRKWVGQVVGSPKRVAEVMSKLGIAPERIHIHRGWFNDTFPKATIDRIALLHIDCDFYEPTVLCLSRWFPHVVSGGCIQFDDYRSFRGCTTAVDEFLATQPNLQMQILGIPGQDQVYYIQKP